MSNAFYKAHKVYGASRDYRIDSLHHTFVVFSNYRDKTHYPLGDAPNKFLRAETGYFETVVHYAMPSSLRSLSGESPKTIGLLTT